MTLEELLEHIESDDGWCTTCKEMTVSGGVEPDAEGYRCPDCNNMTVCGAEQAGLVLMVIPLEEG